MPRAFDVFVAYRQLAMNMMLVLSVLGAHSHRRSFQNIQRCVEVGYEEMT